NLAKLRTRTPRDDLAAQCRQQIARLVWSALHTPLGAFGGPLCQVPAEDRLHELEFHFPQLEPGAVATEGVATIGKPTAPSPRPTHASPTRVQGQEAFLTGIIDLVVRRNGRYFLVDWKTNYLSAYGPDDVAEAVAECDYTRQYRLYVQALARWLGRVR